MYYFAIVNITLHPYRLEFVFPFRIAHGVRTHTDAVFIELECDGIIAFGEATLPPYLPYTQASTMACLSAIDLSLVTYPFDTDQVLAQIKASHRTIEPPAMAAIDMALWTLEAKMKGTTIRSLLGITGTFAPPRLYTISVCEKEEMAGRIKHGYGCGISHFKLKLNGITDWQMLKDFKTFDHSFFAVDANQSWNNLETAIILAKKLQDEGCLLLEQPFPKEDIASTLALSKRISLPICADEACQNYDDIDRVADTFTGINAKLQKCGGIAEAYRMIKHAKEKRMGVVLGCMSESAIGCDAAYALAPLCDWNDLDGKYLVKEVPFKN